MNEDEPFDLGNYEKLGKIGSGSFGCVYKCREKSTGKIFAAKVSIKSYDDQNHEESKNLKREVENISKVSHPCIIHFVGFSNKDFVNNDYPTIVTEYLPNGSLRDMIESPASEWTDTRKLINLYGIVTGMQYLHFHDVLHRDLKPDNILLDSYLFPRIADFGLSRDENILSSTVDIKGSPIYIAPEIWEENTYSKASDVYAFGFITYEVLTGIHPFSTLTLFQLQNKVVKGGRPPLDKIESEIFRELIQKCWSKDPSERPTFDQIREQLKKNKDFITEKINEDDFIHYRTQIDRSRKKFDLHKSLPINITFNRDTEAFHQVKLDKKRILSFGTYNKLKKSCQIMIDEAISDPDVQFEVGKCLIEGQKGFPVDINAGVLYLKSSIEEINIDAAIYYNRMLISGKIIPKDLNNAKKNLEKYKIHDNPEINLLIGIIERKKENYAEAIDILYEIACQSKGKGKKYVEAEASYQLGKMLYRGEGVEENKEQSEEFFNLAKKNGCKKIDSFLKKSKSKKSKVNKNKKYVDIIFLIDGSQPMSTIYESFHESLSEIEESFQNDMFSKILFRYGAIIYKNKPIADQMQQAIKSKHSKLVYQKFTDNLDEIQNFFMKNKCCGGDSNSAFDWASGYECFLNKFIWGEKAEKIVIHICYLPALGRTFTMDRNYMNLIKIPKFKKEEDDNLIFMKIQNQERTRLKKLIKKAAESEIMFFCINCHDLSLYCFKQVRDLYIENDGKKFVIQDQLDLDDQDEQTSIITKFITDSVDSCINKKQNDFEEQNNDKFEKDYKKYMKSLKKLPLSTQSTKPKAKLQPPKGVRPKQKKSTYISDDDDDDDEGYTKNKGKIGQKHRSTPSLPNIKPRSDDDDDNEDSDDDHYKKKIRKKKNPFDF